MPARLEVSRPVPSSGMFQKRNVPVCALDCITCIQLWSQGKEDVVQLSLRVTEAVCSVHVWWNSVIRCKLVNWHPGKQQWTTTNWSQDCKWRTENNCSKTWYMLQHDHIFLFFPTSPCPSQKLPSTAGFCIFVNTYTSCSFFQISVTKSPLTLVFMLHKFDFACYCLSPQHLFIILSDSP
jgi:hypothetical protein